jgi:hypothetical protein
MAVVNVQDVDTFKAAVEYSLKHYKKTKKEVDSSKYGAHYLEQLLIHQHLTAYSEEYRLAAIREETFMVAKAPLTVQTNQSTEIKNVSWPFSFNTSYKCKCCVNQSKTKHTLKCVESLTNFLSFDFGGYTHFSYLQWNQLFQVIVIAHIVDNFGEEVMLNAHRFFKQRYKQRGLPEYSEAELYYELLRDNGLFTKS